MKKYFIICIFLLPVISANAQREGTWWHFGYNVGFDFTEVFNGNATYPKAICNAPLRQNEGVFSISDKNGNWLMSSDGKYVYTPGSIKGATFPLPTNSADGDFSINKNNILFGNSSATQSGIMCPVPGETSLYYIFTIDDKQSNPRKGINYSIIDLAANNGVGELVIGKINKSVTYGYQKNSLTERYTAANVMENITLTPSSDGNYWLVSIFGSHFHAWKVTKDGVSDTPVLSLSSYEFASTTSSNSYRGGLGHIRISADGTRIAYAIDQASNTTPVGVFGTAFFNNSTGEVTSSKHATKNIAAYGVEFSPSNEWLYLTNMGSAGFIKFSDLANGSMNNYRNMITTGEFNAVMGPKGIIYMIVRGSSTLYTIDDPNNPDTAVPANTYKAHPNFFACGGASVYPFNGLPNFIPSFFLVKALTGPAELCTGAEGEFILEAEQGTSGYGAEYIEWDMGDNTKYYTGDHPLADPSTKPWPTDNLHKIKHTYTSSGVKTIRTNPYNSNGLMPDKEVTLNITVKDCVTYIYINPHLRAKIIQ